MDRHDDQPRRRDDVGEVGRHVPMGGGDTGERGVGLRAERAADDQHGHDREDKHKGQCQRISGHQPQLGPYEPCHRSPHEPEHPQHARIRSAQTLDALHRGRLPSTVGADQAGEVVGPNVKIEPVYHNPVSTRGRQHINPWMDSALSFQVETAT